METLLRVLEWEQIQVESVALRREPRMTVLIPDGGLYRRYLSQLGPDGDSLDQVFLLEQIVGWYGDDEGAVTLRLVEDSEGNIDWERTVDDQPATSPT